MFETLRKFVKEKQNYPKPNKIAILKIGAIGDVLMSTPFVRSLRNEFSEAQIDYWTGKWSAPIIETNTNLNKVIPFDEKIFYDKKKFALLKLARQIRKEKYDMLLLLDKSWMVGVFGIMTGIKTRVGFDRAGEGWGHNIRVPYGLRKHEMAFYLDLAKAVGGKDTALKMDLELNEADEKEAHKFMREFKVTRGCIGLVPGGAKNPGQNMASRRWPYFTDLSKKIEEKIVLFGGPGDDEIAQKIIAIRPDAINACGKLSLRATAALMKFCKLIITNDAGPMHLAGAVGVPTLGIFGPTDPIRKAPDKWVWHEMNLDEAEVFAKYSPDAMNNINKVSVNEVLRAIKNFEE